MTTNNKTQAEGSVPLDVAHKLELNGLKAHLDAREDALDAVITFYLTKQGEHGAIQSFCDRDPLSTARILAVHGAVGALSLAALQEMGQKLTRRDAEPEDAA